MLLEHRGNYSNKTRCPEEFYCTRKWNKWHCSKEGFTQWQTSLDRPIRKNIICIDELLKNHRCTIQQTLMCPSITFSLFTEWIKFAWSWVGVLLGREAKYLHPLCIYQSLPFYIANCSFNIKPQKVALLDFVKMLFATSNADWLLTRNVPIPFIPSRIRYLCAWYRPIPSTDPIPGYVSGYSALCTTSPIWIYTIMLWCASPYIESGE